MISVITVVRNDEKGIEDTILSVINQTARDQIEYIIIDGASTDRTIEIINQYKSNIDYFLSESDKGIYDAMNKGIQIASGEYCIFMNSGDNFNNLKVIERLIQDKEFGKYDFFQGEINDITPKGLVKTLPPKPEQIKGSYLFKHPLAHQAAFIRTSLLKRDRYDDTYKICADAKFFIKHLIFENATYKDLNFCISDYNNEGLSTTNWYLGKVERERIMRELFPQRILVDYIRMTNGETTLEKILCKIDKRSLTYKILTLISVLLYAPKSLYHRMKMNLSKWQRR